MRRYKGARFRADTARLRLAVVLGRPFHRKLEADFRPIWTPGRRSREGLRLSAVGLVVAFVEVLGVDNLDRVGTSRNPL